MRGEGGFDGKPGTWFRSGPAPGPIRPSPAPRWGCQPGGVQRGSSSHLDIRDRSVRPTDDRPQRRAGTRARERPGPTARQGARHPAKRANAPGSPGTPPPGPISWPIASELADADLIGQRGGGKCGRNAAREGPGNGAAGSRGLSEAGRKPSRPPAGEKKSLGPGAAGGKRATDSAAQLGMPVGRMDSAALGGISRRVRGVLPGLGGAVQRVVPCDKTFPAPAPPSEHAGPSSPCSRAEEATDTHTPSTLCGGGTERHRPRIGSGAGAGRHSLSATPSLASHSARGQATRGNAANPRFTTSRFTSSRPRAGALPAPASAAGAPAPAAFAPAARPGGPWPPGASWDGSEVFARGRNAAATVRRA